MELNKLEQIIGYTFRDKQLLQRAVTHSSYANEKLGSPGEGNERLEFLGDAVLGTCVGLQLYNRYKDKEEGYLTKMRASIVCERSLGTAGKKLGINEFLLLSKGEESGGGRERKEYGANDLFRKKIKNRKSKKSTISVSSCVRVRER